MKYCWFHVGNGGFSLRKISKMIAVTEHYKAIIDKCMADSNSFFPEDVFLLLNTHDKEVHLKRPSYKLAMKFAIEQIPAWSYRANGCQLPFGCHNWTHPENDRMISSGVVCSFLGPCLVLGLKTV